MKPHYLDIKITTITTPVTAKDLQVFKHNKEFYLKSSTYNKLFTN